MPTMRLQLSTPALLKAPCTCSTDVKWSPILWSLYFSFRGSTPAAGAEENLLEEEADAPIQQSKGISSPFLTTTSNAH